MTRDAFSLVVSLLGKIAGIFSIVVSYLTIGVESDKKKTIVFDVPPKCKTTCNICNNAYIPI